MEKKILNRIEKEFTSLSSDPICGAKVFKEEGSKYKWKILLPGPKNCPYEGGNFTLELNLQNYPFKCPQVKFVTKIYHPNIKYDTGEICSELFSLDWAPTEKIGNIISKISSLLFLPLLTSPLEPTIAYEYLNDYDTYNQKVIKCIKGENVEIKQIDKKEENVNKEIKEKKLIFAENEEEEEVQMYLAKKESEEFAKIIKEEEKQMQMAIEQSEKENKINQVNNINNINKIEESDEKKNKYQKEEEEFDEEYGICPITQDYMENPVIVPSGNYYEKSAIIEWIEKNHTDPLTREKLSIDMLIEDNDYKKKIIEYRKKFNK